ncbi:MAG: hypothetical protein ABJ246_10665 [Paracoccaceae bacterium]
MAKQARWSNGGEKYSRKNELRWKIIGKFRYKNLFDENRAKDAGNAVFYN